MSLAECSNAWSRRGAGRRPGGCFSSEPSARSCSMPSGCSISPRWQNPWRGLPRINMLALTERIYPMNMKTAWEEVHTDTPPEEALPAALPADDSVEEPVVTVNEDSARGLAELLLKNPGRVERLNRDQTRLPLLVPRFLIIALASYALFAAAMIGIFGLVPAAALPRLIPTNGWSKAAALGLLLGYTVGLVAASGVCLPSFYFYGLLAGVKISMLQVVAQTLKGAAATAIMLIGVLPIYVAVTLGLCVFN